MLWKLPLLMRINRPELQRTIQALPARGRTTAPMLWYCWYNFGRVHKSLRTTPAMESKLTDHVWGVRELLEAA